MFLRNKLMFLEVVFFKRSGTKLFVFTIVCKIYLKVWLCRNVHDLISSFNKQIDFDKKSHVFSGVTLVHTSLALSWAVFQKVQKI